MLYFRRSDLIWVLQLRTVVCRFCGSFVPANADVVSLCVDSTVHMCDWPHDVAASPTGVSAHYYSHTRRIGQDRLIRVRAIERLKCLRTYSRFECLCVFVRACGFANSIKRVYVVSATAKCVIPCAPTSVALDSDFVAVFECLSIQSVFFFFNKNHACIRQTAK